MASRCKDGFCKGMHWLTGVFSYLGSLDSCSGWSQTELGIMWGHQKLCVLMDELLKPTDTLPIWARWACLPVFYLSQDHDTADFFGRKVTMKVIKMIVSQLAESVSRRSELDYSYPALHRNNSRIEICFSACRSVLGGDLVVANHSCLSACTGKTPRLTICCSKWKRCEVNRRLTGKYWDLQGSLVSTEI